MTRLPRPLLVFLLSSVLGWLVGCASAPVQIDAPPTSEPYAILQFSSAMQLIAFNDQAIDPSQPIRTLRVRPGSHTLRFVHLNDGPEGSAAHAGQQADPFTLEVHEGVTYEFAAKTWGIIWRPEVAEYSAIPDYCVTHACEKVAAYLLQQRLQTADCNWIPPGKPGFCKEAMMSEKAEFRQFYRDAHAVPNLSEREKIFMGLAVAFTRNCQPWVERRLADARKAGIDEYDLDCAVDVIAAVDAGILQSLNIRSKAQLKRNADDKDR